MEDGSVEAPIWDRSDDVSAQDKIGRLRAAHTAIGKLLAQIRCQGGAVCPHEGCGALSTIILQTMSDI